MKRLLNKEIKLSASFLSYVFILFGLIALFPGYPVLVGGFFVCLGIFQSFQSSREANDILYTALLPIKKADAVKSKYLFCLFIEGCSFLISTAVVLLRMTVFVDFSAYRNNALMNANLVYLGFLLVIFGLFNAVFVCGFFKTAYRFAKPFFVFILLTFAVVGVAESLHYISFLAGLNAFGFENLPLQVGCLLAGMAVFVLLTAVSEKRAEVYFEKIDL